MIELLIEQLSGLLSERLIELLVKSCCPSC